MNIESYVRIKQYSYQQEDNRIVVPGTTSNVISIPLGIRKSYVEKSFRLTKLRKMEHTILVYRIFLSTLGVYDEEFLVIKDLIFKKEAQQALSIQKSISATVISEEPHNSVLVDIDRKAGAIIIPLNEFVPILYPGDIMEIAIKVKVCNEDAEFWANQNPIVKIRDQSGQTEELQAIRLNGIRIINPGLKVDCVSEMPKGSYVFAEDAIIYTITLCNTGNTQIQIPKGMVRNKIPKESVFQCILKEPYKESFVYRHGILYNTQELVIPPQNEGNHIVKISFMVKLARKER